MLSGYNNGIFDNIRTIDMGYKVRSITSADFDQDEDVDIALALWNAPFNQRIAVLKNDGGGNFPDIEYYADYRGNNRWYGDPTRIKTYDIDNDGDNDLIYLLTNFEGGNLIVRMNNDGRFDEPHLYPVNPYYYNCGVSDLTASDLDSDGDLDLAVAVFWCGQSNSILATFENNGSGGFSEAIHHYGIGGLATSIASADFYPLDGNTDIALVTAGAPNNPNQRIKILRGTNSVDTFIKREEFPVAAIPREIAVGNFDSNNFLDIAVASVDGDKITVYLNGC